MARLFDPLALAIVFGGAALAALLRGGFSTLSAALASLKPLVAADPEADALAAIVAVGQVEAVAAARSVVCADRVATAGRFMREALRHLADAPSSEVFMRWAEDSLGARRLRHAAVTAFWRDAADAAPAMGMVATVLGLIAMFANMEDPAKLGPPMASALVATLWGILVANLIAGPIADRLERLSTAELAWQERTLAQLAALARAELDQAHGLQRHLARRFGT
ncbi:motility protein A [Sphingomonas nostoxanthinifaciens]|uniref:motility protein A n=1 Tax=Sphingomonas nostoxanthinifaciens TaxID=2872652 RepID=UPI001CC21CC6|nr:MotA/TolQ/ExbB proton channel family protein [Sphingomonas nostoxanthinifaciens]